MLVVKPFSVLLLVCCSLLAAATLGGGSGMPRGTSLGNHECIHNKVARDQLPFIVNGGVPRDKRSVGFSRIRISTHFVEPLHAAVREQLTSPMGPFAKALELLSSTLLVRQVQGNLTVQPECDQYAFGPNNGKCWVLHSSTECGPFPIPDRYLGTREVCTSSDGPCDEEGPRGSGAEETDFLLLVGTQNEMNCVLSSTLAFAAACAKDVWHRPTVGYINFCAKTLIRNTYPERVMEVMFNLILHELSHALGFSESRFDDFHDGNLVFYNPETTGYYDGAPIKGLKSPKVLTVGRSYFHCHDLPFVPLENNDGTSSHWEARILHHETMAAFLSNDYAVFSNFTLAFFEDSGWYQVNHSYINDFNQLNLKWGKGLGCAFVLEPCSSPETYPYLCNETIIHHCSFDRLSKGSCKSNHTFFDGCPVVVADDHTSCLHEANTPVPNYGYEVYSEDSICVELNATIGDCLPRGGKTRCYQKHVVQDPQADHAVSITVNGSQYWCKDSEILHTDHGFLFCPPVDEVLLRVPKEEITSVEQLPKPDNIIGYTNDGDTVVYEYITGGEGSGSSSGPGFGSGSGFESVSGSSSSSDSSSVRELLDTCEIFEEEGCSYGDVRLVYGSTYSGRVEVCINDAWGTVCDDGWSPNDASVVCRQLGYDHRGAVALRYAFFGQGTGEILFSNVGCSGEESEILDCSSTPPRDGCDHDEDAGVSCAGPCEHGSIRLVDGPHHTRGNVEMCVDGSWGVLCSGSWDNSDATVVCKEKGYPPYGALALVDTFPPTHSSFIRSLTECSGGESSLINCTHNVRITDTCPSGTGVAGVSCLDAALPNAPCTDGEIRLRNGYIEGEGRVEICVNNAWGTVCDNGWDDSDASVVCRELGYHPAGIAKLYGFFGQGRGPIVLEDVQCNGLEESLFDCANSGLRYSSCGHYEDAGVICQVRPPSATTPCTLGDVRLMNGSSELEGRVEVCFGDIWVTVCDDYWDNRDAGVVCKEFFNTNYGGLALGGSAAFGSGDNPVLIHSLNCDGTEEGIKECSIVPSSSFICSASEVASVICNGPAPVDVNCTDGELRLANGFSELEGRVEICLNDTWGPVCGNQWDVPDANVVCRQLGYIPLASDTSNDSYFGVGYGSHSLSIHYCSGGEEQLLACSHSIETSSCSLTDQVGVRCMVPLTTCTEGDVRLLDGRNEYEGRVEVCQYGIWGTVRHTAWDSLDAAVVCQQLGYHGLGAIAHGYSFFGRTTGPVWIDNVNCNGHETHLLNCSHSLPNRALQIHDWDAGIQCPVPSNDSCSRNSDIRVVGGSSELEGRVEICYDNQWGTVCDDLWGTSDAMVACRQLGHTSFGAVAYSTSSFGGGTGGVYLDNVGCYGSERKLTDCYHLGIGVHNCDHSDDAGVSCQPRGNCTDNEVQLVDGLTSREGRVEICIDGLWGDICAYYLQWGLNEARVVCRQLGYPTIGTRAFSYYTFGRGTEPWIGRVDCVGEEEYLVNCTYNTWISYCPYGGAGVRCPVPTNTGIVCEDGELRLIGGSSSNEGRVEMCYENQWGTVCDDSWGAPDANVVCKKLGFSSFGVPFVSAYFGRGSGLILLDDVGCSGNEASLLDCSHNGVTSHNCGHSEDSGVRCAVRIGCTEGDIRLVGGSTVKEGRVEVCVDSVWGTVCDFIWSSTDAGVVCKQLGFPSLGAIPFSTTQFGQGSGPIVLGSTSCDGSEEALLNCSHYDVGVLASYCYHGYDRGVECPTVTMDSCMNGDIRLVNGQSANEGRVEVCYDNHWGTVCDDYWSSTDAKVVCKQLGYATIGATAFSYSNFGGGTGGIFLDDVGCVGDEDSLINCTHRRVGVHNCDHTGDAGVRCAVKSNCTEGSIRLVGGSNEREGRVEVCIEEVWGTICDTNWDSIDAGVVCRQLGFLSLGAIYFSDAHFGYGTVPILLNALACDGSEATLLNCSNSAVASYCGHDDDAGVQCPVPSPGTTCTSGDIQLVGGSTPNEGRVEICQDNQWGTVCDDLWSSYDAGVVCRQLGYAYEGSIAYSYSYFGEGTGGIFLDNVGCTGSEIALINCSHRGIGVHNCDHTDDAGVTCHVPCNNGDLRLRGGTGPHEGRVEMCYSNQWGTICDDYWGYTDANVVCRQLGYSSYGSRAFSYSSFGRGSGSILLDDVGCTGSESRLIDCYHRGVGVHDYYCDHYDDAGVRCIEKDGCSDRNIRIVGGGSEREGRVEVCSDGTWGTVCDSGWDSKDASVVCKQLGFHSLGAIPFYNSHFDVGSGGVPPSGAIILDAVSCTGGEENLFDCSHGGLGIISSYCDHGDDAGVYCPVFFPNVSCANGAARLVGGSAETEGRVEICYNNQWGTVCDDLWDTNDAGVACRQVGHSSLGATARSYSYFGGGTGGIFLDNVGCTGREIALINCAHSGIGVHNCDHTDDAGVTCIALTSTNYTCDDGDLRLVDGSVSNEGRVEMCFENQWGTVCDDSWDASDANVVCRKLGFPPFGATSFFSAYFGRGSGPILLDDVGCSGNEASLLDCSHRGVTSHNCGHSEDSGVRCAARTNCTEGSNRLIGGSTEREGRVEVCADGVWGTVCDSYWNSQDATVVCRQLGLSSLGAIPFYDSYFGRGSIPIALDALSCDGSEETLLNCSHSGVGVYRRYCDHGDDAGVQCPIGPSPGITCTNGDIRLMDGQRPNEGRVEICYDNQWGTVCDDSWGSTDAGVACRQLGYASVGSIAYSYSYFGGGTGGIFLDNVGCRGSEIALINCSHSGIGVHNCDHTDDAGVRCHVPCDNGDLRLEGGTGLHEGRVEMCYNNQWGTICDDYWSSVDAKVVCRQLEFSPYGSSAFRNSYFGRGSGSILLDDVGCTGSENRLIDCYHRGVGVYSYYCDHGDDAGVRCIETANCTNGEIRLVGGTNEREGRVEICYEKTWGTVCDDYWGSSDATVVCKQLGFAIYGASALSYSTFGRGSGPILLDNVGCTGSESRLIDCSHRGVGVHGCSHSEDSGVRCAERANCTNGDIRLVGGITEREGRVEICHQETWGTICDSGWDSRDADVVCGQLGFPSLGAIPSYNSIQSVPASGPIILNAVSCAGDEMNLINCSHSGFGVISSYCVHQNDAGVYCPVPLLNVSCANGAAHLVGGSAETEGRVEICYNNQWGTVCDDLWGVADARVVCRQLGFSTLGTQALSGAYFGQGTGPILLESLSCFGEESSLFNCSHIGIGVHNCDHTDDAGVRCQDFIPTNVTCDDGDLRLMGGSVSNEGRVEMCYENQWGTVCDDVWGAFDARVVCKQLGHPMFGATGFSYSYFGRGSGLILLDNVGCSGTEARLIDCFHSGVGTHDSYCDHSDDAGVRCIVRDGCTEGEVRLVGGSTHREGRVEVCIDGVWGTICDNSWDSKDADVVCRQLGFPSLGAVPLLNAHFGAGSGVILLDYVSCTGMEENLTDCTHNGYGVFSSYCDHYDDASVHCPAPARTNCTDGDIRLVDGLTESEGRVEICYGSQWGTVCHDLWSTIDAQVVCRQLGYISSGATAYISSYFGGGIGAVFMDNVGCLGTEQALINCTHTGIGVHNCDHTDDAGVRCPAPCNNSDLRLEGGTGPHEGRVEMCYGNQWGTICDDLFGSIDAKVVCRQLGFPTYGARVYGWYQFGRGLGPIYLDDVGCTGTESRLIDCRHRGIGVHDYYCDHYDDVGVRCRVPECDHGSVRLASGSRQGEGRVELCNEGAWGTICDASWLAEEAIVVCRQLGLSPYGALPYTGAHFGQGSGPVWLNTVACNGDEEYLLDCQHGDIVEIAYSSYCNHRDDVGVQCSVFSPEGSACSDGDVRLMGGRTESEGRVEVCYSNSWGTVCDDYWSDDDAQVVCRQLGHYPIGGTVYDSSHIGEGAGGIFLDDVQCSGDESSLINCTHAGIGMHNCDHTSDAKVKCAVKTSCSNGDIQLTLGREGTVQICHDGVWGTICDTLWDHQAASTTCAQLGFPSVGAVAYSNSHYGSGRGPIWLDRIQCTGEENNLENCTHPEFLDVGGFCDHNDDAGVECAVHSNCTHGDVRLFNNHGSNVREGSVEVCIEGVWGTICDNSWDSREADVICRQLGYSSLGSIGEDSAQFGEGSGAILLDSLECTGNESSILGCLHNGVGVIASSCEHNDDAGVRCISPAIATRDCTNGDIRLTGTSNELEGRVEICYDNQWGTVCDDSWSSKEAIVVCRQLGHSSYGATRLYSTIGGGSGGIFLDDVECSASESSLVECAHSGIGVHDCTHSDDASVMCQERSNDCLDGQIRLMDGESTREGRVEVCLEGLWGTICDYLWYTNDARVICRDLGMPTLGAEAYRYSFFGRGSGPIWMSNVNCEGEENTLLDCSWKSIGQFSCGHYNDAGVRCPAPILSPKPCTSGELRLVNGSSPNEGRVEICYENQWGSVCDYYLTNQEANVVCKQLGYPSIGATAVPSAFFGQASGPIILDMPNGCRGNESRLIDCQHRGVGVIGSYCVHYHDAGVRCAIPCEHTGELQLVNGTNSREGRVEICLNGTWSSTCDYTWTTSDARVVCRQLGYPTLGAKELSYGYFGKGTGPLWLTGVHCTGEEDSLLNCSLSSGGCSHYADVGVQCPARRSTSISCKNGDLRLVNGSASNEGRVEMCYENQWGTVCGSYSFDSNANKVACRQLGYPTIGAHYYLGNQPFGYGNGSVLMYDLHCTGNESRLINCPSSYGIGVYNDRCSYHVGVVCAVKTNCTEGSIVLVEGEAENKGKILVCTDGIWGSICGYPWNSHDASVVCEQIGFKSLGAVPLQWNSGAKRRPLLLDSVSCTGNEEGLLQCSHNKAESAYHCSTNYVAGVQCPVPSTTDDTPCINGDARLVNGSAEYEGRVEMCYDNQWGTICADQWNNVAASVVCAQLGFMEEGAAAIGYSYFGEGTGGIFLDDVSCTGNELTLLECRHREVGVHNCQHYNDASVKCQEQCSQNGEIRLTNGVNSHEGRVEICLDGLWSTVCDEFWDESDARVACRQLGFLTLGAEALSGAYFGDGFGPVWADDVKCNGEEPNLLECPITGLAVQCRHSQDVGIRCPAPLEDDTTCSNGDLRLVGGPVPNEGRVEVCYENQWGTVCDDLWGQTEANVVCRQLGYTSDGATYLGDSYFGGGDGVVMLDNVECVGKEARLFDCPHSGVGIHNRFCDHTNDAGVKCIDAPPTRDPGTVGGIITVVFSSNTVTFDEDEVENIVELLEEYIVTYCAESLCDYIGQNSRSVRVDGVEIHIISQSTREDGSIEITFYVTTPNGVLSTESLEDILTEATEPDGVLGQDGIVMEEVHTGLSPTSPSTSDESDSEESSIVIVLGVLLALVICILLAVLFASLTLKLVRRQLKRKEFDLRQLPQAPRIPHPASEKAMEFNLEMGPIA